MKKKILILQNNILHYRKSLFNELSKNYDVVVLHSGNKTVIETDSYSELIVKQTFFYGFIFQKNVLKEVLKPDYHKVIAMFDLHYINNILSYFIVKKGKFIWWGQWITGNFIADKLKVWLSNGVNKSILYSYAASCELEKHGVKPENLIVANNTIEVSSNNRSYESPIKDTFLFVGSLNRRKRLDIVINAFALIAKEIDANISLTIIGEGECKENLLVLIKERKLMNRVKFKGKITDSNILSTYYQKSIACVSFGQAGLSVLQSMGNGVPFITSKLAISGGEKTNIINGYNGYLCEDNVESLAKLLQTFSNDKSLTRTLGKNAFEYYSKKCTIKNMANGFIKAIKSN